jgi:hypothetical protein
VPKRHQKRAAEVAALVAQDIEASTNTHPCDIIPTLNRYGCASPFMPCAFKEVCLAMDDGVDYRELLDQTFVTGKPHFDEGINDET